jgi:long-chain fatty acid transport protein
VRRSTDAVVRSLLLACAVLAPASAGAQDPSALVTPPQVAPDEVDFEGLTSLSLGSGARALGMGGAFLARADDATAVSWNPAGLSYLGRPEFSIVGTRNSFERGPDGSPATDRFAGYGPDFVALTYPLSRGAIQLNYQRVFSFGGTRDIARETDVFRTEGSGGFDVLGLGAGVRMGRKVRVGGAFNLWVNGYSQRRLRTTTLPPPRGRGATEQDIDYDLGSGVNFNVGLLYSPVENLNLGVVGRTPFTAILNLRRFRRDFGPSNSADEFTENLGERSDVLIDLPGSIGLGASWRATSAFTVSADYTRTLWSHGRVRNFFRVEPTPEGGEAPPPETFASLPYPTLDDPDQVDTQQVRLGAEYVLIAGRVKIPLRAGFFVDRQYFRAAPAVAGGLGLAPWFRGYTAGTGISVGPVLVDVALVHERGAFRSRDDLAQAATRFTRVVLSLTFRPGS